jgi:ribose 5-phosphate isomerase B
MIYRGIPARFTSIPQAVEIVEAFLATEFEGGRHQNRVNKIVYVSGFINKI